MGVGRRILAKGSTSYCIGKWIAYLFGRVSYEVVRRSKIEKCSRKDRGVSNDTIDAEHHCCMQ